MRNRRSAFAGGRLSAERVAALEAIPGWLWDLVKEAEFQRGLGALKQFVAREGHTLVPGSHVEVFQGEEVRLGGWAKSRRHAYKGETLRAEWVAALEAVPSWVWDFREAIYNQKLSALKQFVAREGHGQVPRGHVEIAQEVEVQLGSWVSEQRMLHGKAQLADERITVLETLPGWVWDPFEAKFQRGLGALKQFVAREGHTLVPVSHVEVFQGEEVRLGSWVVSQRHEHGKAQLADERIAVLETLPGWVWDIFEANFQQGLGALKQFVTREGHGSIPKGHIERFDGQEVQLLSWVTSRRGNYKKGKLSAERVAALEEIPGWVWDPVEASLHRSFSALEQFVAREGHALVPGSHVEVFQGEEVHLGSWANSRRTAYNKGRLHEGFISRLEQQPGWVWDILEANFQRGLGALEQFVAREGHARVPGSHVEVFEGEEFRLGSWIISHRSRKDKKTPSQIAALDAIPGWEWDPNEAAYQRSLAALRQFVAREGHARPRQGHVEVFEGEEFALPRWVGHLRTRYRKGVLSPQKIAELESVSCWLWDPKRSEYERGVKALAQFVEREGHAQVPFSKVEAFDGKPIGLGLWVNERRSEFKKGKLSKERIDALEALPGWVWSVR